MSSCRFGRSPIELGQKVNQSWPAPACVGLNAAPAIALLTCCSSDAAAIKARDGFAGEGAQECA